MTVGPAASVEIISIHALRVEGDRGPKAMCRQTTSISIHALRVEGDMLLKSVYDILKNFYPRPPCGGRQVDTLSEVQNFTISIHALRVEGDR